MSPDPGSYVSDIGEKRLIEEFIRPFFEPPDGPRTIGDDCALVEVPGGSDVVLSTDRVPADLIAFQHGIIGHEGLGRYLAALNVSDIAASGGEVTGLLLNLGLPAAMRFGELRELCEGFLACATELGARVLGGDVTASGELSIAATGVGIVPKGRGLRRNGARPGDWLFVSKSLGVTPAAFTYLLSLARPQRLAHLEGQLFKNFTHPTPLPELGRELSRSGVCTSCMDNTDGYSETLHELSRESGARVVLEAEKVEVADCVLEVAREAGVTPLDAALGPGADFGLVGTIKPDREWVLALRRTCGDFRIVGRIEEGAGVVVELACGQVPLARSGWNYFSDEAERLAAPGPSHFVD